MQWVAQGKSTLCLLYTSIPAGDALSIANVPTALLPLHPDRKNRRVNPDIEAFPGNSYVPVFLFLPAAVPLEFQPAAKTGLPADAAPARLSPVSGLSLATVHFHSFPLSKNRQLPIFAARCV